MPTADVLELMSFWPAHADFFGPFEAAGKRGVKVIAISSDGRERALA